VKVVDRDTDYWELNWVRFKEGDKEAFAIFYNQHIDRLYRYGLKICKDDETVKDAIQEVFLDLYLKREQNNSNPENLKYYLLLALKRNLIKKLKNTRRFDRGERWEIRNNDVDFSVEYQIIEYEQDEETRHKVIEALDQLPGKQKEAVYLRFNEAMEYTDIAVILGVNVESVRKQVYRALKTVREMIDNKANVILFHFFKKNF